MGEKFDYEGVPAVTGISPNTLDAGGNTEVKIMGTGLYPASAVHFIGTQDPLFSTAMPLITNESPTQLVVVVPGGSTLEEYYVAVTTPQARSRLGARLPGLLRCQ